MHEPADEESVADQRYFYGAVKGVAVSPGEIPEGQSEGRKTNLARRSPVRVDVYYGPSNARTREEALEEAGAVVFPEDHVEFFPEPSLGMGTRITVLRATEVLVDDMGQEFIYRTWSQTVDELLTEQELDLGPHDALTPNLDNRLVRRMSINIKRADDSLQIDRTPLPFKVIVEDDPRLPAGKVRIKQQGEAGEWQKVWRVIRRDGEEINRTLIEDKEARPPRDRIVLRGTKPVHFNGPYYDWIQEAARTYGADADAMYRVMMCESGGDPYAVSPSGKYLGLFQYDARTWSVSGWGDHDRFDPYAQINAAAKAWPSRYTKWPITSHVCGDLGN